MKDGRNQKSKGGTVLVLEFTAPESFSYLVCENTILHYHLIPISTTFFHKVPSHLNDLDVRASVGNTTRSFHILLLCLCPPLPPCQQGFQHICTLLNTLVFPSTPCQQGLLNIFYSLKNSCKHNSKCTLHILCSTKGGDAVASSWHSILTCNHEGETFVLPTL